ncbi:MAG: hypothetical protein EOP66_03785 [Sphingomonas sp.]|nr:MAG: hypothetical protein EOP66_03785 [Sphingomonas sp.]
MSGYGFGKRVGRGKPNERTAADDRIDLSGISRRSISVDPEREEEAIRRGDAIGFVDRGNAPVATRRRQPSVPQKSIFIKGPADTLDWFIEYANERGHRSYWNALEELRALAEKA